MNIIAVFAIKSFGIRWDPDRGENPGTWSAETAQGQDGLVQRFIPTPVLDTCQPRA